MKARKGYLKGMNQDSTFSKVNDDTYFFMKNFRVVTDEGASLGSIENEKGHILGFEIPNIPETTYNNGQVSFTIPEQNNLRIVGWTTINEIVVVLTTNTITENPVNAISQIWAFEIDPVTNQIIGGVNNVLDINNHLKYNNALNLSTHYRVKVVGIYENLSTARIYFTDNYNSVKSFNILDPNGLFVPVSLLGLNSEVNFNAIIPTNIGTGQLQEGIKVQASYRLLSKSGSSTLYAPPTPLIPIPKSSFQVSDLHLFSGEATPGNKTKSASFLFKELDSRYDIIEFILIVYDTLNTASIYKVGESVIPSSREIEYTYTSIDTAEVVPVTLFNIFNSGFSIAKDIEIKDSLLIAANTKSDSAIIEFDARAYRFDSNQQSKLVDGNLNNDLQIDGNTLEVTDLVTLQPIGTWSDIPENHDAINPYNITFDDNADWESNRQYKYQNDGVTLGGSGTKVSYSFVIDKQVASNNISSVTNQTLNLNPPHISVPKLNQIKTNNIVINSNADVVEFDMSNQFANPASFINHAYFSNHARGEVYRYAICFYDKNNSVNYVNWIGDIKIPEINELNTNGFPLLNRIDINGNTTEEGWLNNIGIEFTVDISSIQDKISGFSIVRVLRDRDNRSKLGTGLLMWFETRFPNEAPGALLDYGTFGGDYEDDIWSAYRKTSGYNMERSTESRLEVNGQVNRYLIPRETVGFGSAADVPGDRDKKCITYLISPLGRELIFDINETDFLRTSAYYGGKAHVIGQSASISQNDNKLGFVYTLNSISTNGDPAFTNIHNTEFLEIFAGKRLNRGELLGGQWSNFLLNQYNLADNLINTGFGVPLGLGGPFNTFTPFGIGAEKLMLLLKNGNLSKTWFSNPVTDGVELYNPQTGDSFNTSPALTHRLPQFPLAPNFGETSTVFSPFKEVQYCRYLENQYGGNTYLDRSKNQYLYIGHFQPLIQGINNYTNQLFFGDTYVNYYDQEITVPYNSQSADGFNSTILKQHQADRNVISTTVIAPVESPINLEFRERLVFSKYRRGDELENTPNPFMRIDYNFVYANYDIVTNKFFAQDILIADIEEHPNRVWYSENKINGELLDSWRSFLPLNYYEVEGSRGPINKIINFKGDIYFYQNRALGKLLINERSLIQDSTGVQLTLGTGTGIQDHQYISRETGSMHQYAVINSRNYLYHFDARLKKMFRLGEGLEPISDSKNLSSFFAKEVKSNLVNTDKTLSELNVGNVGIEAVYDNRYNRVIFTFLGNEVITRRNLRIEQFFQINDIIYFTNIGYFKVVENFSLNAGELIVPNSDSRLMRIKSNNVGFTVTFNEFLDAYESFYDFVPGIYLEYGTYLLSRSPYSNNKAFIHNLGEYGFYYGEERFNSFIRTVLNTQGDFTKVFNNLSYYSQVTQNDQDIPLDTFNTIRVFNDYQDTGVLNVQATSRRRMRTWRHTIKRDILSTSNRARIRNSWAYLDLDFENVGNKRIIAHDIMYSFIPTEN